MAIALKPKLSTFQVHKAVSTKAGVVFPNIYDSKILLSSEARLEEAVGLAQSINLNVCFAEITNLKTVKAGNFFGQGYIDKLKATVDTEGIELLIIDASLSPIQQRNLEKKLQIKVIDRTALILEIFGERAQTKEGKLQVELAHLSYQRSRLVRSWTHLERQRGGAGFLGGPGETQIELDRRIIDDKIVRIKKELDKVKQTRSLQRCARQKIPYPVVALVGYTNAGKSSIFNRLTGAGVFAQDLLFATLDPTMRRIRLPQGNEVILSDTVGFISDLPHELIMAFRATLEEVLEADVIVHVRDISNPDSNAQKKDVLSVLTSLGLEHSDSANNYIELLNKTDLLPPEDVSRLEKNSLRHPNIIPVSAQSGAGMERFLTEVENILTSQDKQILVQLPAQDGKTIAWLHANSQVLSSQCQGDKLSFSIKISSDNLSRLQGKSGVKILS